MSRNRTYRNFAVECKSKPITISPLLYINIYFHIQIAHEFTKFVDVMNINIVNISEDIKAGTNNMRGKQILKNSHSRIIYPLHNLYAKPTTVYFYLPLEWTPAFKRDYNGAL